MTDEQQTLKADDAAKFLLISEITLRRHGKNGGDLPAPIKIGRLHFWRKKDLQDFLDGIWKPTETETKTKKNGRPRKS